MMSTASWALSVAKLCRFGAVFALEETGGWNAFTECRGNDGLRVFQIYFLARTHELALREIGATAAITFR